jgi:23S rRNA (adenine2503-C2)-methyltransferase
VTKDVRDEIVPINRKFGLDQLLQACSDYPGAPTPGASRSNT